MGVRNAILRRWNRRDVLAVLVIGVTVAFLTGTTLVVVAAATGTTDVARGYDSAGTVAYVESVEDARARTPADAVILPLATVTAPTGSERSVVGIPEGARDRLGEIGIDLQVPPDVGVRRGAVSGAREVRLEGTRGAATVRVRPASKAGAIPPAWYVGPPGLVERLGPTGALVVAPADGDRPADVEGASAIRGALPFFVRGTRSIVRLLYGVGVGVGVLAAVTVFSVSRMAVADRRRTVGVFRATGGTGRAVVATFAARAALLTGAGVLLGYAIGVIVPSAIVNAGIFVGVRTSLTPQVTPLVARFLAPVYAGTLVLGTLAGGLAARSIARTPPARVIRRPDEGTGTNGAPERSTWLPPRLRPTLVKWRTLAPTAATLTVFVVVVVLGWSAGATVAPALGSGGTTITEPGAVHPVASTVPEGYATALEGTGVNASPEILAFTLLDDRPVLVRGGEFGAFASVSDARLVAGSSPSTPREAVVGEDLAARLDLQPGERVALGGSTTPTVTRVTVVGVYAAPGPFDDQVLVPLPTARHLTGKRPGIVQFVRTDRVPDAGAEGEGLTAVEVAVPERVPANRSVQVSATVLNGGPSPVTERMTARLGPATDATQLSLDPLERRTVTFTLRAPAAGTHTLAVLDARREVRVRNATAIDGGNSSPANGETGTIRIEGLRERVPPNSTRRVRVLTAAGTPAANATIEVGDRRVGTDDDGVAAVPFGGPGTVTVVAAVQGNTTRRTVNVTPSARRTLEIDVEITPSRPSSLTRATVIVGATNPWGPPLDRTITVAIAGRTERRHLQVPPGERAAVRVELPRLTPGEYQIRTVVTTADGDRTATVTEVLRIRGNDRLVAALAARGREGGATSIGSAVEAVFGNLTLVTAGIVVLAGLMSVGSVAATFAGAIHGRRRTLGIRRATGAGPWRVLQMVLADALRIGVPGIALATVAGYGLLLIASRLGQLTAFGIAIDPVVTPWLLGSVVLGAVAVVVAGATVTTLGVLRAEPARLLRGDRVGPRRSGGGEARE
jgi:ABC-type lipoprotein release transport system permease subunit